MKPYRSRLLAIAASLSIHVLVLLLYSPLTRIMPGSRDVDQPAAAAARPIMFDLVETPDDALRRRPENATHVSNKDALARNEVRPEDLPRGEAYSEGISDYSVFRGESGSDASQADEADRQLSGEDRPMEDPHDMVIRVPIDLGQVFSRNRASSMRSEQKSEGRSFTDDADLDHRSSAAEALGGITLNTYNWDFADYILAMKKKLRSNTHPPGAFSPLGLIDGRTVLTFRVMPDGKVTGLTVKGYEGDRTLMETSVDAVESSSPFPPLPDDFPEEYLELTWTFIYYVYRR
ncbi:MAG TPA: hypothetical protein VLA34_01680 [Candidatus Krumholzibacterium sp.]|nr:hypothetical protein [Candidatus Krumholzibacterium sp.]